MTNRFLISAAAVALIAGTGFANAQGTGTTREAPSAGSTVQQSAPSSERGAPSAAPMNREGASDAKGAADHGMKATQSDEKMPQGSKNQRAQDDMKAGAKGEKSAQDNNLKGEKSKGMSSETQDKGAASKDMKAEGREGRSNTNAEQKGAADSKSQPTTQSQAGQKGPSQTTTQQGGQNTQSQTTGNAATSATAAPPAEKRTQITSAFKQERVEQVTNVNFNVAIGTAVPASVRFHPIPSRIVEIYPEWRGYDFIIVNGRYVILRPQTHEIVYIIEG
jgi:hypothetical protein